MDPRDLRDYSELRANVANGIEKLPPRLAELTEAAKARMNRLCIAYGMIFAYWDSEAKQRELAEAYRPLKVESNVLKSYPPNDRGRSDRRFHERADELGIRNYPELTATEREAESYFKVLLSYSAKLGGTDKFRPLTRKELKLLRKLNGLSRKPSELEVYTAAKP